MDNPLLAREGLPPFDRIAPSHVVPAVRQVLAEAERELEAIERDPLPTWEGLMEPLERPCFPLERVLAGLFDLAGRLFGPDGFRRGRDPQLYRMLKCGISGGH